MSSRSVAQGPPIPKWGLIVGSVLIAGHLGALLVMVLAAPSGPWVAPPPVNSIRGPAPEFAASLNSLATPCYLRQLQFTHNYHFPSNRPGTPSVFLKAYLKDKDGNVVKEVTIPDPDANPAARQRQQMLAQVVASDVEIPQQGGPTQKIAPDGTRPQSLYWEAVPGKREMELKRIDNHLILNKRIERMENPTMQSPVIIQPSRWSLILLQSYSRFLRREHNLPQGGTVELERHSQMPIPPDALMEVNDQNREQIEAFFQTEISRYGNVEQYPSHEGGAQ